MRTDDHILPFHDLHYLYALARVGDEGEAESFLAGMGQRAAAEGDGADNVWAAVAIPAGEAILDFLRDRRGAAAKSLRALTPVLHRIGGSHAQRHVFVETLEACNAGGDAASGRQS